MWSRSGRPMDTLLRYFTVRRAAVSNRSPSVATPVEDRGRPRNWCIRRILSYGGPVVAAPYSNLVARPIAGRADTGEGCAHHETCVRGPADGSPDRAVRPGGDGDGDRRGGGDGADVGAAPGGAGRGVAGAGGAAVDGRTRVARGDDSESSVGWRRRRRVRAVHDRRGTAPRRAAGGGAGCCGEGGCRAGRRRARSGTGRCRGGGQAGCRRTGRSAGGCGAGGACAGCA